MLVVTPAIKEFAVKSLAVDADASDDVIRKAVGEAIATGKMTLEQLNELTAVKTSEAEKRLADLVSKSAASAAATAVAEVMKQFQTQPQKSQTEEVKPEGAPAQQKATATDGAATPPVEAPNPAKAYALGGRSVGFDDEATRVRVKSAIEQFDDTRTAATFDRGGNEYLSKHFGGRSITSHFDNLPYTPDMPTARSKAIVGVWAKNMLLKDMRRLGMPINPAFELKEMERDILQYTVHNCKFIGELPGQFGNYDLEGEKLHSDLMRKAVLDDTVSGGLEAVPIEFDAAVILTPLLTGEVFPYVTVTNVSRRRIEAAAIGNPTLHWGVAEGTAINLFDTDGFISEFNNNIHPLTGAIEIGLDFLADSPLAVADIIINRFGLAFRQMMDNVILTGNGVNQPEGIFNAAGVGVIPSANGVSGPPTMGDYEGLMFGVGKEYLQEAGFPPASRAAFFGTQTSYQRARSIKVNASADERRLYGMDHMSYRLHDFRYAINSTLTNNQIGFCCLNRYRLYRRQGLELRVARDGDWGLIRSNKQGIALRARYGGALEKGAAMAKIIDAMN